MNLAWWVQLIQRYWPTPDPVPTDKDSRFDFKAVNDAQQKSHEREMENLRAVVAMLQEDLGGVRAELREADSQNRDLRREIQQLHQQHLNCETTQRALAVRVEELEAEVKRLQQRPTGDF